MWLQVMQMYSPEELGSAMKESGSLAGHLSRVLVQEIRRRAANQSTGAPFLPGRGEVEGRGVGGRAGGGGDSRAGGAQGGGSLTARLPRGAALAQRLVPPLRPRVPPPGAVRAGFCLPSPSRTDRKELVVWKVVEASVKAALTSTLAKAVYLFYDLPALPPSDVASAAKRDLIRDLFSNVRPHSHTPLSV